MLLIVQALLFALNIYQIILIARVLIGWIQLDRSNRTVNSIVEFLYAATEPVLRPIRNLLPPLPLDLSPLIVLLGISLLMRVLPGLLL